MTNLELAKLLRKIAAAYTILDENRFKIIAYDNAATAVEHATSELKDLWDDNNLDSVPALGPSISSHLDELFRTGHSKHFDEILKKINPVVFGLLEVPGLGPKRATKLVDELGLKSVADLEKAAKTHRIAPIASFGTKSEQDILDNLERFKKGAIKEKRMSLPQADEIADEIIEYLGFPVEKLGSLRRRVSTIGDIDLAVATRKPQKIIAKFVSFPKKVSLIEQGSTGASILLASGRQADLRVAKPEEFGAMLQYFTGSKYHNIGLRELALKKGLSINEYGITEVKNQKSKVHKFSTEEAIYNFIGLRYIPPELREDTGEIDAALHNSLPKLVELKDIRGDLQMHSDFDLETSHDAGANTIGELREMGKQLGYEYIAITNHNPSSKHSKNQIIDKIRKQTEYIGQLNSKTKDVRVLSMLEVDIQPNGELPIPQDALDFLDGCLVSIHSEFNLDKETMTKRVLTGLSNPVARIFAHPTGRLLEKREGYELDWPKIFSFCLRHDKALEINAFPNRLDLPDTLVRQAVSLGVKLSIGTDAHHKEDLILIKYGVSVARRGWAEKKDIINTWSYDKILKWMRQRG